MPITKTIHDFNELTSIDAGDELAVWDISSNTTRRITFANFQSGYLTATTGLQASGATVGATSQAQEFTNGIITTLLKATSGTTSTLTLANAGATTPVLDIVGGGGSRLAMRFSDITTDATTKQARFVSRHYLAAEEDVLMFYANNLNGTNQVNLGGGSASFNVVSDWRIHCASDSTTTGTAVVVRITATGISSGHTNAATAWLDAAAATSSLASLRMRSGTRPTTPATGTQWFDGAIVAYAEDSTTNAIVNSLKLERGSSGTPAAGFGLGILAQLESSTTITQDAGRLTWEWATATHATRASKGKLTAYYTSTEREAITWVADSSGAQVGINTPSPAATLHIASAGVTRVAIGYPDSASAYGEVGFRDETSGNVKWGFGANSDSAGVPNAFYLFQYRDSAESAVNAYRLLVDNTGRMGIGTTAPQGILHGHDGSGGFMFVNRVVGSTLVTVIPDGTGDVTENISFLGWVSSSTGFVSKVDDDRLTTSNSLFKIDGGNTLTIAVTAAGAFTLQATAGAATWKVCLWVFWR